MPVFTQLVGGRTSASPYSTFQFLEVLGHSSHVLRESSQVSSCSCSPEHPLSFEKFLYRLPIWYAPSQLECTVVCSLTTFLHLGWGVGMNPCCLEQGGTLGDDSVGMDHWSVNCLSLCCRGRRGFRKSPLIIPGGQWRVEIGPRS